MWSLLAVAGGLVALGIEIKKDMQRLERYEFLRRLRQLRTLRRSREYNN
jgi:hypothetical protein